MMMIVMMLQCLQVKLFASLQAAGGDITLKLRRRGLKQSCGEGQEIAIFRQMTAAFRQRRFSLFLP